MQGPEKIFTAGAGNFSREDAGIPPWNSVELFCQKKARTSTFAVWTVVKISSFLPSYLKEDSRNRVKRYSKLHPQIHVLPMVLPFVSSYGNAALSPLTAASSLLNSVRS